MRSKTHTLNLQQEVYHAMTLRFYLKVNQGHLMLVSRWFCTWLSYSHQNILHWKCHALFIVCTIVMLNNPTNIKLWIYIAIWSLSLVFVLLVNIKWFQNYSVYLVEILWNGPWGRNVSFSLIVNEFNINLFFLWKLRGYREIYIGFIYLITLQSSQWLHWSRYSVSVVIIMLGICRGQKNYFKITVSI